MERPDLEALRNKIVMVAALIHGDDCESKDKHTHRCNEAHEAIGMFDDLARSLESRGAEGPAPGVDLEAAERTIETASKTLGDFCKEVWAGRIKEAWHWEIPANPARDTDLLIGAAIGLANDLVKEVRTLRAALRSPAPAPLPLGGGN
jgi:hypothetical protein